MKATAFSIGRSSSLVMAAMLALSACASGGIRDDERLALHRAHAGEAVGSFSFFGRIDGWSPLGDSALTVRTKPNEAWLLELSGPCPDLEFAHTIGLTSNMNRVHARFDKVLVNSPGAVRMPCYIDTIRPLDVKALKVSEKELREARIEEREADGG
jgi:hypothetical protein